MTADWGYIDTKDIGLYFKTPRVTSPYGYRIIRDLILRYIYMDINEFLSQYYRTGGRSYIIFAIITISITINITTPIIVTYHRSLPVLSAPGFLIRICDMAFAGLLIINVDGNDSGSSK